MGWGRDKEGSGGLSIAPGALWVQERGAEGLKKGDDGSGYKLAALSAIGAKSRGALREGSASQEVTGDKFQGAGRVGGPKAFFLH